MLEQAWWIFATLCFLPLYLAIVAPLKLFVLLPLWGLLLAGVGLILDPR